MAPPPRAGMVDYLLTALDATQAAAVSSWTSSAANVGGTIVVSFANSMCPVCSDDAHPPKWSPRKVIAIAARTGGEEQIVVSCACRQPHTGRPLTEAFGCGRVWTVKFTWDSKPSVGPVSAGPMPSDADLGFAARLADLKASELTRVRAQAQGWATVMAGLTGLVGVGQLFASPSADILAAPWRNAVGAALLVALVLAAASSVLAGLAAYGRLNSVVLWNTAATGGEAGRFQDETDRMVAATKQWLEIAAVPAAVAFLLVLFSGSAMWWAPRAAATSTAVCVVGSNGNMTQLASLPKVTSGSVTVVACEP